MKTVYNKGDITFNVFAFSIVLFLYSSVIKQLITLPVDITALSFIVASLSFCFLDKVVVSRSVMLGCTLFICVLMISSLYSKSDNVNLYKLLATAPGLILTMLIMSIDYHKYSFDSFLRFFCFFSIPLSIVFIYILPTLFTGNDSSVERSIYLSLPFYLSISAIFSIVAFRNNKFIYISTLSINIFSILISGARGPLIALVFCLLLLFSKDIISMVVRKKLAKIIITISFVVFLLFFVYYFDVFSMDVFDRSWRRLLLLFDGGGNSLSERFYALNMTYEKGFDSYFSIFFGEGLGSFGVIVYGVDQYYYPHNVPLEILFEMGLMGLFSFAFIIIACSRCVSSNSTYRLFFYTVLIFVLFNFMKSYSIVGLRLLFPILTISLIFSKYSNKHKEYYND
ncbi:TPA: O-antigen ligase family protein [Vibrio parahaemolyticus]